MKYFSSFALIATLSVSAIVACTTTNVIERPVPIGDAGAQADGNSAEPAEDPEHLAPRAGQRAVSVSRLADAVQLERDVEPWRCAVSPRVWSAERR